VRSWPLYSTVLSCTVLYCTVLYCCTVLSVSLEDSRVTHTVLGISLSNEQGAELATLQYCTVLSEDGSVTILEEKVLAVFTVLF